MKKIIKISFFLFHLICAVSYAQCGLYEISLNQKVNESNFIIEGEVIKQQCFKSTRVNKIYTLNTIKVYSVIKGILPQQIEIITAGGRVKNEMESASSLLQLHLGEIGLFFLNKETLENTIKNQELYNVYASSQGFLQYNLTEQIVSDVFINYSNIDNSFYKLLKNSFDLQKRTTYQAIEWSQSSANERLTVINNFSPNNINAGVAAQITINGFGFGSSRGDNKVLFKNTDKGGSTDISAENEQYISWSDTKIVVEVPHKAGTGKIAVTVGSTKSESSSSLKVNYAIINTGGNGLIYPARHVAKNENQGYIWHINSNFESDSTVMNNFLMSFKKWRCKTYINWTIGTNTIINISERDTISAITFDENNELPPGVLGLCYSYYSGCSEDDWYIEEQDLLFRKSDLWHYGDEQIPFNKLDFQSVVLHELGHAHQLAHVINVSDLMHYSIANGVQKRNIESINLEAAQWMMNKSQESDICDKKRMQLLDDDLCNDEYFGFFNTVIYPNPFDAFLNIDFYLTKNDHLKVSLFDVQGKLIALYENAGAQKGFFPLVFDVPQHLISAGVYILKIEIGEEKMVKKLIKQ
jgi:hypothetical protein